MGRPLTNPGTTPADQAEALAAQKQRDESARADFAKNLGDTERGRRATPGTTTLDGTKAPEQK
jgi:hypothetical protein